MGGIPIKKTWVLGTRGSDLALAQARWVSDRIIKRHEGVKVETVVVKTRGDFMQDVSLAKIGGKGVFVKEIEEALLRGEIDFAVHSMKDVPVEIPEGLEIAVLPEREDPRDVLVSREKQKIEELRKGARIGTGSLRRASQLRNLLPDIEIVPLRGNLETRLRKIDTEDLDGVVVAAAGIRRMGWVHRVSQFIPVEVMLPSIGQGALGIEIRQDDKDLRRALSFLSHETTEIEVAAERAFLGRLGGGCQLPVAAFGKRIGNDLLLRAMAGSIDGFVLIRDEMKGAVDDITSLGVELAERILSRGGQALLDQVYSRS
ncbi:MAG: hydroxymethylbilane synthase [Deltaproteobacteria bacterium]|nr:hydroxymethylbilane synthase [Deltaproteobacteria bacterium]